VNQLNNNPSLVFVYLGKMPEYVQYSLLLNSRYNKITLLCDADFELVIPNINVVNVKSFYNGNEFNNLADDSAKRFRDGFWVKTIERLYVLYAYMKHANLRRIFHGEIDNLIFSLDNIADVLDRQGTGLFYPMLTNKIAAASLMYINSIDEMESLISFFNAQTTFKDEMLMLAEYVEHSNNVYTLPAENNTNNEIDVTLDNEKLVFDVAAFGQYLFGIDLRNSGRPVFNKYQNIHCRTDLSKLNFRMDEATGQIYVQRDHQELKLINIHIHSKIFKRIYQQTDYVTNVINKLNNRKRTLISLNIRNYKYIRNLFQILAVK